MPARASCSQPRRARSSAGLRRSHPQPLWRRSIAPAQGVVYKGLALLGSRLYATDFHNARVDVFTARSSPLLSTGAFTDPKVPKGSAPFGVQALNGSIFVTYAKQDSARHDDVAGGGLGYVDEYSPGGVLLARVAQQGKKNGPLNAPWGLALPPRPRSAFSQATCSSVTSATVASARTSGAATGATATRVSSASPTERRLRSRDAGRSRSATMPPPARHDPLLRRGARR